MWSLAAHCVAAFYANSQIIQLRDSKMTFLLWMRRVFGKCRHDSFLEEFLWWYPFNWFECNDKSFTFDYIWFIWIEKKKYEIQFGGWPSRQSSSTHGYHKIINIVFFFFFFISLISIWSRGWFVFVKNCLTLFVSSGICRCHLPAMCVHYMYKHTPRSLNTRMKTKWSGKKETIDDSFYWLELWNTDVSKMKRNR